MAREKWIEICKSKGLEIEEIPQIGKKHLEKEDFIRQKIEEERIESKKLLMEAKEKIDKANEYVQEAEKRAEKAHIARIISIEKATDAEARAEEAEERAKSAEQREKEFEKEALDSIKATEIAEKIIRKQKSQKNKLALEIEDLKNQKDSLESLLVFTKETLKENQRELEKAVKKDANIYVPGALRPKVNDAIQRTVKYHQDFADDVHRLCWKVYCHAKGNTLERRKVAGKAVHPYVQQFRDVSTESKLDAYVSEVVQAAGLRFEVRKSYRDNRDKGISTKDYFHPFYTDYDQPQQTKDVPIPTLTLESREQEQDDWRYLSETEKADLQNRRLD